MTTILLAQGVQSDLSELYGILQKNHISCLPTLSAIKALEILESGTSIDLVLSSITMPMRSGWDILKHIKRDQKLFYIPVIITFDNIDQETALRCLKMGASDIITKPFTEATVIDKIQKVLKLRKPTVLVVDDEKEVLDLIRQIVEMEKFKAITALSVEEGLEILKQQSVDAVVSDINLPGMTGVDLLKSVQENHKDLPVILITGFSKHYTPKFAMDLGASGFFYKPFKNVDLIRKLKQVMPNHFQRIY